MNARETLARRFFADARWPYQFARYCSIGSVSFAVDVGSFVLMLRTALPLPVVATLSYALGTVTHFTLNKYVNFRAHDRPVRRQLAVYAAVVFVCWSITVAIVEGGVWLGAPAVFAKIVAVAVTVPIGFLGHRYLTFARRSS